MFYNTVSENTSSTQGASRILQGELKASKATQALARIYLDITYDPRSVPVLLKYDSLARALFDPKSWANSRGVKIE